MVVSHSLKANIWENEFKFEFELPFKWIVPMHVPCSMLGVCISVCSMNMYMIAKHRTIGIGFLAHWNLIYEMFEAFH